MQRSPYDDTRVATRQVAQMWPSETEVDLAAHFKCECCVSLGIFYIIFV